MLINGSALSGMPVLSLHMGGPVAKVAMPVIDPNTLKIIALLVEGQVRGLGDILDVNDVRELANIGIIIDSTDVLSQAGDVVKIDEVRKLNFNLVGLKVETKKGTRLGRVTDYTVESKSMMIQQIIVRRPLIKAIVDPELVINRKEIVEITDYKVIVRSEEEKLRERATNQDFIPNFVNPFREPQFSPSRNQSPDE